jgi:hypothetical protein
MKYCRQEDVVVRSVAGAHLLVPIHTCTHSVYTLNGTGRQLWELIETPRTEEELSNSLIADYQISQEMARHDVNLFLTDMVKMGLVIEQE